MANTIIEDQQIKSALQLVRIAYGPFLPSDTQSQEFIEKVLFGKEVEPYVEFFDQAAFSKLAGLGGDVSRGTSNCLTCGMTKTYTATGKRKIIINRAAAGPTTMVHELLHFFAHLNFAKQVQSKLLEAITERFTRKVLGKIATLPGTGASKFSDFRPAERDGHYDKNVQFLSLGRGGIKAMVPKDQRKGYMKKAYFQGDQQSIKLILDNLGDLDALFEE